MIPFHFRRIIMPSRNQIKEAVLDRIADGQGWVTARGPTNYSISGKIIHLRFCSTDRKRISHYKFNINPNTLRADYEVWICGGINNYYLIPINLIAKIYSDPDTYPDRRHPEIRVVSVSSENHIVNYGQGGKKIDLTSFYNKVIKYI